jgi:hypothetical protein
MGWWDASQKCHPQVAFFPGKLGLTFEIHIHSHSTPPPPSWGDLMAVGELPSLSHYHTVYESHKQSFPTCVCVCQWQ